MELKLGSLFDGMGTAPLAARMLGIEPVWASEIEKYPIAVTTKNFPNMKHLGDITKINGADIEPVQIIVAGSPCQDLSIAGKQAGLHDGERSHLFYEAIRIVKEMKEAHGTEGTVDNVGRWFIWENVPGAFTSNRGEDFRCVLEAFCRIADETASVPMPEKGKWASAGCIVGNGYSIAWRVLDSQYWFVPQRRKRIFLVADTGGERAGSILLKPDGLSGNFTPCGAAWERIAGYAPQGT